MSIIKQEKIIIILGPTASGKTKFAVKLAKIFDGEIISADSRQVYKNMDLGTGKDLFEYKNIPYHLIDIKSPKQQFNLSEFQIKANQAIKKIQKNKKLPFLVGGTGLYLQSIIEGWQLPKVKPNLTLRKKLSTKSLTQLQKLAKAKKLNLNQSDLANKRRLIRQLEIAAQNQNIIWQKKPQFSCLVIGLTFPRELLNKRIDQRLQQRLQQGLVAEVKKLKQKISDEKLEAFGLEYKWVNRYVNNKISHEEMVSELSKAIHHYAKRQMTWFRRMARQGIKINWNPSLVETKKMIKDFMK